MTNHKKQLLFEKSITRSWSLFIVQMLHGGLTSEFRKQFDFSYSEVLFDFRGEYVDIYRAPEEHIEQMRSFILEQLNRDYEFIHKASSQLLELYDEFIRNIKEVDKLNLSKLENKELLKVLDNFIDVHARLEPTFVINFWFPIQMENHSDNKKWAEVITIASETRAKTEKVGPEGERIATKLADEINNRIFSHAKYSRVLNLEEAGAFLKNNTLPKQNDLEKRLKGFIYGSQGIKYISLEEYSKSAGHAIKKEVISDQELIKGTSACQGYVEGVVRKIISTDKINTLKRGEILVTSMTTPEFLPAMKKASAFITDEGGITCHAAIVAREMKKPCVIGTKVATKVLKDGDSVVVDANKGVVRIVKK